MLGQKRTHGALHLLYLHCVRFLSHYALGKMCSSRNNSKSQVRLKTGVGRILREAVLVELLN